MSSGGVAVVVIITMIITLIVIFSDILKTK